LKLLGCIFFFIFKNLRPCQDHNIFPAMFKVQYKVNFWVKTLKMAFTRRKDK
jgi:hypothetical protein